MKTVIIIINYNNPDCTEKCLKSISESSSSPEVVVVDNASTKGDIDAACRKFDNVKLIKSTENLGFGRGNNLGMKWALDNTDCEYIFLLNHDAYVEKDSIAILEEYMDANPGVGICSPRIMFADEPAKIWYGGGELNWRRGLIRTRSFMQEFDGDSHPVEVTFVSGCAMMIRKETLMRSGGFDPRYFMYAEDIELCARVVSLGGRLSYVPESVVYHDVHRSIRAKDDEFRTYMSPDNKNLPFYLENAVCNFLLTLNTYASGADKVLGHLYLIAKWGFWSLKYVMLGRADAVSAILRGLRGYLDVRKIPVSDELGVLGKNG